VKIYLSKKKWYPKSKVKVMVILQNQKGHLMCLSDKLKIFIYLFIYFSGTGVRTQGLMLARQAINHLSHPIS
jgi:hypothetical protein